MALRPLTPAVRHPLENGWDLIVSQAGMAARGLRLMITTMNGDPKAQHSVGVGVKTEEQRFIDDVVGLTALDAATVSQALVTLAYNAEGVWRAQRQPHGNEDTLPGQPFTFEEIAPWDTPVDGAALLDEIRNTYTRFAVLPSGAAEALALWTLHTYAIEAFDVTPYISVCSPVMGCGKTRIIEIGGEVAYRPVHTANATPAATFRLIDQWEPTLLIDEQDTFLGQNVELKGVLNTGYKRGATIPRVVGDTQEVRQFKTFSPKMIAGIGQLPQTLRDRSIKVLMEKKGPQRVAKWTRKRRAELADLRRRCLRWAHDNMPTLLDIEPSMPEDLSDRAEEIWEPLFQIAAAAGGDWPKRTRDAVALLQGTDVADEDIRIQLLADLRDIFATRERVASDDLPKFLHPLEDRPWAEYGRKNPKPITKGQIQAILRSFGIKAKQFRAGDDRHSGYEREQFSKVFGQYLVNPNVTTRQTSNDANSRQFLAPDTPTAVTSGKTAKTHADTALSRCHVPDRGNPGGGHTFSANTPCPRPGCIGRLELVTGNGVMCGVCYWQPDAPAAPSDGFEDREEWTL